MLKILCILATMSIAAPAVSQTVTTVADLGRLSFGDGMTIGPDGAIYVAGGFSSSVILRVQLGQDIQSTTVTEHVTGLESAAGIWFDQSGNLYTNNHSGNSIYKVDDEGTVSVFATGLDGPAGLTTNSAGDFFVSEYGANVSGQGRSVSRVSPNGTVHPFARENGLIDPLGIAVDENDNVYAANWRTGEVFRIDPSGTMSLLATIPETVNQMAYADGVLYLPAPTGHRVYSLTLAGEVSVLAGSGLSGQTDGVAQEARFANPNSTAITAGSDNLYVLDSGSGKIRMISLAGATDTQAGEQLPAELTVSVFPNPTAGNTTLLYHIPRSGQVRISLVDLLGREVLGAASRKDSGGSHLHLFDTAHLPSGVYFYRVELDARAVSGSLIVR